MTAPCPVSVVWVDDRPATPCVLPHGHDGPHQYGQQVSGEEIEAEDHGDRCACPAYPSVTATDHADDCPASAPRP